MHNRTKLLQFSKDTATVILQRDKGCLFCRMGLHMEKSLSFDVSIHDIMHVVNKSQGGLGVEQNGMEGCRWHHTLLDNSSSNSEMREIAEDYMRYIYPGWTRESVTFNKWSNLQFRK